MNTAPTPLPTRLDPDAWYRAPSGRLCRLVGMDGRGGVDPIAKLCYVNGSDGPGSEWADGFNLRRENWRILRRVG